MSFSGVPFSFPTSTNLRTMRIIPVEVISNFLAFFVAGGKRDTPNLTASDKVISPPLTTTTSTGRLSPPPSKKAANPRGEFV